MSSIIRGVRTVRDMIGTGAYRIFGWLTDYRRGSRSLEPALRARYPDAGTNAVNAMLDRLRDSRAAAREFARTGNHPTDASLPREPGLTGPDGPARYVYEVRVTARAQTIGPDGRTITDERRPQLSVYSTEQMTLPQLEMHALGAMRHEESDRSIPGGLGDTRHWEPVSVEILSIRRS